jgi:serine/threonine protein kinase
MQGNTINGFELKRLLGVGGMAEVWYAENRIGKKAAVKLLLPKLCQDENVVSRFLTEAKVMVDLNHPNIRQVHDYGELDGRPTIIMEYLDGEDLKARMKRGQRFTDEELKHWWNQLVDALNYTHKKGIVHRDIKPGNIFVDTEGNVKLLDFGIAKVRDSISTTQTGQKLGTLMYMSPEQVKDSKHIDYHTDIYSLAVTFVHLITGKKPYDSDTSSNYDIEVNIVTKPLDLSNVPAVWRRFLEPYLNKEPQNRPDLKPFSTKAQKTQPKAVPDEKTIIENGGKGKEPLSEDTISQTEVKKEQNEIVKPKVEPDNRNNHNKILKRVVLYLLIADACVLAGVGLDEVLDIGNFWIPIIFVAVLALVIVFLIMKKKNKTQKEVEPVVKFCKQCGNPIDINAQFCKKCGNKLS